MEVYLMRESIRSKRERIYEKMYFKVFGANCGAMTLIGQEKYLEAYRLLKRVGQEREEMYMAMPDNEYEERRKKRFLYSWNPEYQEK